MAWYMSMSPGFEILDVVCPWCLYNRLKSIAMGRGGQFSNRLRFWYRFATESRTEFDSVNGVTGLNSAVNLLQNLSLLLKSPPLPSFAVLWLRFYLMSILQILTLFLSTETEVWDLDDQQSRICHLADFQGFLTDHIAGLLKKFLRFHLIFDHPFMHDYLPATIRLRVLQKFSSFSVRYLAELNCDNTEFRCRINPNRPRISSITIKTVLCYLFIDEGTRKIWKIY